MVWVLLALACASPPVSEGLEAVPAASTEPVHLVRLTHRQWENSVVDLLGLSAPTGYSETFIADVTTSAFDNEAAFLSVTPTLWQQYQAAAEGLAAQVVADPVLYVLNVPQDLRPSGPAPGTAERDAWLAWFGGLAFRRPLREEELLALTAVFEAGPELFVSGDPFVDGVQASLAAVLQSPGFLYRYEGVYAVGEELPADDLASKLSYALWNTMPDAALFDAAAAGLPPEGVEAEVARMLTAYDAHLMVLDLHRQLLHVDSYEHIFRPSEELLAIDGYEDSLPASMQREVYAFVDDVVFGGGTVRDLLTSTTTFVDEKLAPTYGLTGISGDDLVAVALDPTQRSGLLTLSGFLAWQASVTEPNLIQRGAFVNEAFLCVDIPPPPADVAALPSDTEAQTLREVIEDHTTACGGGCHTALINPVGFAFGKYDETGAYVDYDEGLPIDATGTYGFEDGSFAFDGAVELAAVMADRAEVHRCYVTHLLTYLEGRSPTLDDDARIAALTESSLADTPVLDLISEVVASPDFRRQRR